MTQGKPTFKKSNDNRQKRKPNAAVLREREMKMMENNLRSWRLKIKNDREGAERLVESVLKRLSERGRFHPSELMKFKTHMINGVSCPGEYGVSDNFGCAKVAGL